MEDQAPSFTVNEFVGSIISLDKCKYTLNLKLEKHQTDIKNLEDRETMCFGFFFPHC